MARKFAAKLSSAQMDLARRFEQAGFCSISQAVKAFERDDRQQINAWKQALIDENSPRNLEGEKV